MMKAYNRLCAEINLDAVEYNMEMMKKNIKEGVRMIAVLKADGYGHGAVPIAQILEPKDYVWGFATASLDEAAVLRRAGIRKPVIVLGCIFPDQWETMAEQEIRMTIYTKERAEEVSEFAGKLGKKVYVHIKLDTGMGRLGFLPGRKSAESIAQVCSLPNLIVEGMYTHFARADETDKAFTQKQLESYLYMKRALEERGVKFACCHCSNSAGIIDVREGDLDLVRAGISLYGLYPSEEVHKENVPLKPALSLISHAAYVKWVPPGTPVSYGGTFVTERETKIVTVPAGYGDGYPRSLSNKGYVLIHGKRAPVIGRVCMDQFMVDATEIEDVKFGDRITLVGEDGEEKLPVEVLSRLSERFNYEFVCDLGKRIPRTYFRHGKAVSQIDYFD